MSTMTPINKFASKKNRERSSGMTLLEVVIAAGIMSIVMVGLTSMISAQNKQIRNLQIVATRDGIKSLLEHYIKNPQTLSNSAANSLGFKNCYQPGSTTTCSAGTFGLDLYDPRTTGAAKIAGAGVDASTTTAIYYDASGASCGTDSNSRCPIMAYSSYTAECAGGLPTCTFPVSVSVNFTIQQNSNTIGITPLKIINGSFSTSGDTTEKGLITFTTPGIHSWTVPSGVTKVKVSLVGGGGGGGGGCVLPNCRACGGGGGGGWGVALLDVTPGESYAVTVGAGGGGGASTGGTGNSGGSSQFSRPGSTVMVGGGTGGSHVCTVGFGGYGGYPGFGVHTASLNAVIGYGGWGQYGSTHYGGYGGSSGGSYGGGGGNGGGNAYNAGQTGARFGGGGGGSYHNSNQTGGAGASGIVVVEW